MKLNETIRQRRKDLGLTQEQVATRLGVSAAAVHKWEVGASCPDIALLPPLARLLGTDLNALLSFHETLTDREIGLFVNGLSAAVQQEGFEAIFALAMDKLREYPSSGLLAANVATVLDGAWKVFPPENAADYSAAIEDLYRRAAESDCPAAQGQARAMLIFRYADRGEWAQAEELLEGLPPAHPLSIDRETIEISLLLRKKAYDKAAERIETSLLRHITHLNMLFPQLLSALLATGQEEDAAYVARVNQQLAEDLGFTGCVALSAPLALAVHRRDADTCLALLEKMLGDTLGGEGGSGDFARSALFRHLYAQKEKAREGGEVGADRKSLAPVLLHALQNDETMVFLHSHPGFAALLEKYGSKLG